MTKMKLFFGSTILWPFLSVSVMAYTVSDHIKVNQIGYRPVDKKIAVISDPQVGFNSSLSFVPGNVYEVRNALTDGVVFSGNPQPWGNGATHAQSGDRVWWFDFSAFTANGTYYVFDVANNVGSYPFDIGDCVYAEVLKHAVRMFYYQRCGSAKLSSFAGQAWADGTCHSGSLQDLDCRLYSNTDVSTSKDLRGGWHDAGDHNKYVNFTFSTLLDLLLAYGENPSAWADNYGLPGSGNGRPDLLDEIMYELDWLMRMQNADGSVLSMVGATTYGGGSPPSADNLPRRYGPATTSASFSVAAVLALASVQFAAAGQAPYDATLRNAAIAAYNWAEANPGVVFYNSGLIVSGEQELDQYETFVRQFVAAVYLYAATGQVAYKTFIEANYSNLHLMQWGYAYPFEMPQQDALLYYCNLPGASANVINNIRTTYANSIQNSNADNYPSYFNSTDAYRAFVADQNYTWNSNQTKSNQANMFLNMNQYGLNNSFSNEYRDAAKGFVDYFLGVNPLAKVYLSNLSVAGAENSVRSFYHSWFADGSPLWDEVGVSTYGPAPGYIPGGPNPSYALDACCPSGCGSAENNALCQTPVSPPLGQPIQKSYADFNTGWPLNSWTVTEAGIYTNAAFVRMLSKFTSLGCVVTSTSETNLIKAPNLTLYPNPAANELTLAWANFQANSLQYEIFDVTGRGVMSGSEPLHGNTNGNIKIALNLLAGTYFISVKGGSTTLHRKIVVE